MKGKEKDYAENQTRAMMNKEEKGKMKGYVEEKVAKQGQ